MVSSRLSALAVAVSLAPLVAMAQNTVPTTTYQDPLEFHMGLRPAYSIFADTGVMSYTAGLANVTDPGAAYGLHVNVIPIRYLGVELGYDGSLNNLKHSLSPNGTLFGNAAMADLRLNLVPPSRDLPAHLTPFVFAGAGYQNVQPQGFHPTISTANLVAVPVGAGLETDFGDHFLAGARFTYNFLFNETGPFGGRASDLWGVTADLGVRIQ